MKRRPIVLLAFAAALSALAGCGPVSLVANTNIPPPLIVQIPVAVALFMPAEFSAYVHREERWNTRWQVDLGKAQTQGVTRLMTAMFERVVPVDSVNAGAQVQGIRAILEPSVEDYSFVTPRETGSPFYAVSIKYRVNVYLPDGKLADSWGFTGYGTSPAQGFSSANPLAAATALAMRDAGAKLAVEFREQAILRGLIDGPASADQPVREGESEPESSSEQALPAPAPMENATSGEEASGAAGRTPAGEAAEERTPGAAPEAPGATPDPEPAIEGAAPAIEDSTEKGSEPVLLKPRERVHS